MERPQQKKLKLELEDFKSYWGYLPPPIINIVLKYRAVQEMEDARMYHIRRYRDYFGPKHLHPIFKIFDMWECVVLGDFRKLHTIHYGYSPS